MKISVWKSAKTHLNILDVPMIVIDAFLTLELSKEEITKAAPDAIFVKVLN